MISFDSLGNIVNSKHRNENLMIIMFRVYVPYILLMLGVKVRQT